MCCVHNTVPGHFMYTLHGCTSEVFFYRFFFRYRFRGTVDVFIYILQFFRPAVSRTTIMYMYNSARTYVYTCETWRRYTRRTDFLRVHRVDVHIHSRTIYYKGT